MDTMPDLRIEIAKVADLLPYAHNAKIHTAEQVEQIAASIEEFGNNDPIAIWHNADGDMEIVEGHGRLLALKSLGIEECPVIALDHLTDEQRRAYAHVHNQTTLTSGFDLDILQKELDELDFDWESFGFDMPDDIDGIRDDADADEVPDDAEPRVQRGEVWLLGNHRLMCGDSSSSDDMDRLLDGVEPLFVFTDPPYGVSIGDKNKELQSIQRAGRITENIIGDTLPASELYDVLVKAFSNLREHCSDDCSYYVSSPQGGELCLMMMEMMRDAELPVRHNLIWAKNNATFSMGRLDYDYKHEPIFYTWTKRHHFYGKNETSLQEFDKPMASKLHPTMKPVALVEHLMENSSKQGDPVADIFGGSGTTLIAAEQLGRTCYIMELDPHYCDVIIERWENLTGKTAVKEGE